MADLIRRYGLLLPEQLEPMRIVVVKVLIKTMNEVILKKFIENKGLEILSEWLDPILKILEENILSQR